MDSSFRSSGAITEAPNDFPQAVAELAAVVGADHVSVAEATRALWSRCTLPQGTVPRAVVRPASAAEVQEIVRIAGRRRLALHPISCGKNWGYGDACAPQDGQVILDLRRMNRIIEVNEELAYATIEPGVTQGQLVTYLEERSLALWADATGAGPDASIVGNTLERGFGHTVNGDRFLNACGLEIVLADGRLLKTGFHHYQGAQAGPVFKWGLGPYLDGLFTQSNLGIVTRMTFWLMPRPPCFRAFLLSVAKEADIGNLVEALRPLRLSGTLRTPIHLFNDLRLLSGLEPYPWEEMQGQTPLSEELRERMKARHGLRAWHGTGALYGSRGEVSAAATVLRRAMRRCGAQVVLLDDWRLNAAKCVARFLGVFGWGEKLTRRLDKVQIVYDLLKGKPSHECLQGARWRVRPRPAAALVSSSDPLDHGAGLLWLAPVLPMTRQHIDRLTALVKPFFQCHDFEYQVTLSAVTPRALCAVMTISYDRSNPAETERAGRCYDELMTALLAAGYIPYRVGNRSMGQLDVLSEVFWDVAEALKAALDPHGILSPGHYEPHRARTGLPGRATPREVAAALAPLTEGYHLAPLQATGPMVPSAETVVPSPAPSEPATIVPPRRRR